MEIEGLDYNTKREKLKLMAYGRDIQQMVQQCVSLPTKEERQRCANTIIEAMKRIVPSQQSNRERVPALWYHLALMSDFRLDIDYPVEIVHEDKMATPPERIPYNKQQTVARHYGRLLAALFDKLKEMPEGEERDALVTLAAQQMYRSLQVWGVGAMDKERIASDLAKYTDGAVQVLPSEIVLDEVPKTDQPMEAKRKKKKKK